MDASPPRPSKWSDDRFLDTLRDRSDEPANRCARDLPRDDALAFLFSKMRTDAQLPSVTELPPAFATFLKEARESLDFSDLTGAEMAKLRRGQQAFMTHALPMSLALLCKSLQEGYQAPRLGKVLMMSGELDSSTYRRVVGVLQMLIAVSTPEAYEPKLKSDILPASDAALTAVKIRLMHAGLRGIAKRKFPEFTRLYGGEPISMEDMLATLIGFSWLVIEGLRTLKIGLSAEDEEAYYFVWAAFARAMGIHPPGQQKSWECIPRTLAEAAEFYATYQRRHYAELAENPEGVQLALSNMRMLQRRMPPFAARIYMRQLMGPRASDRLGIKPYPLPLLKLLYLNFPRAWVGTWRLLDRKRRDGGARHMELSRFILQDIVTIEYKDKIPSYRVPRDVNEIQEVVTGTQPGFNFGRDQFAREVFPMELGDIAKRRAALNLPTERLKGPPASTQGLVGLSLSGGGIRSATFAVGAVQALARQGCLKMVDYLSTVSGGGYTGSMLSSVLNDRESALEGRAFPLDYTTGQVEPPALRQIRNGSNYLAGGGLLNEARLPTIVIRGLLLNALLVLPYVMLAAVLTAIVYPWLYATNSAALIALTAFLLFLASMWSYPAIMALLGRNWAWAQRNAIENLQTISVLFFAIAVVTVLFSGMISGVIESGTSPAVEALESEVSGSPDANWTFELALVMLAVLGYALVRVGKFAESIRKRTSQIFLFFLGLSAPALVFGAYLALLPFVARSPYLSTNAAVTLFNSLNGLDHFPDGLRDSTGARLSGAQFKERLTKAEGLAEARMTKGTFIRDSSLFDELANRGVWEARFGEYVFWARQIEADTLRFELVPIPMVELVSDSLDEARINLFNALATIATGDSLGSRHPVSLGMDSVAAGLVPRGGSGAAHSLTTHVDSVLRDPSTDRYLVESTGRVGEPTRIVALAGGHEEAFLRLRGVDFGSSPFDWWFVGLGLLLFVGNALWVDVNITSPHTFWRDRLSRVFLFRSRWFGKPEPNDDFKLSEMGTQNPAVPYHIINTSLNLTGSRVEDLPGRGSDFFMFSRRYCGSYATGYCATTGMEEADHHINVGTAFAISAAATAPNSGTVTVKPLVFMLTLLNIRLDYWAPNPWYVQGTSALRRFAAKRGRPGPWYLLREALGSLHARGAFVNLSDGGHIENLAVYEMLRRRCKVIVCADAEQDQTMSCASLAKLIRYARIDLGIEIHIDLDPLNLDDTTKFTHRHWTVGTIEYGNHERGYLLYVKSSMTGDEAPYVKDYRKRNPTFPQESTADQFFDEAQFESYRALGYHSMNGALKAMSSVDVGDGSHGSPEALKGIRDALGLDRTRSSSQLEAMAGA